MRELNECTAEVFRRSEKRIRERKRNRNRVLALCIPAFLVLAIWSAMSLPIRVPLMETYDQNRAPGEVVGNAEGSFVCPYTAVEIQGAGLFPAEHDGKVTEEEAVAEMFRAIHSLFAEVDGINQNVGGNFPALEDNGNLDLAESPGKSRGYTITFAAKDGSQTVYILGENTLLNVSTNETIFLSDAQIAGLMAVIGILA